MDKPKRIIIIFIGVTIASVVMQYGAASDTMWIIGAGGGVAFLMGMVWGGVSQMTEIKRGLITLLGVTIATIVMQWGVISSSPILAGLGGLLLFFVGMYWGRGYPK